ncbi:MAG: YdcF family protein [Acidimicrobiales bacterium]
MRRGLRVGVALGVVVAIPVVYLGVTFFQVWSASRSDSARPAEAIVVFGAAQYNGRPSRVLAARLDHAIQLWRRGLAPLVVVTGGGQPGDRFTEATASADYLHEHGVPDSVILREVKGRSSWQSLAAAAAFLRLRQVHRVLLVSDPFHSFRITAMAAELGLDGRASPTHTSPIRGFAALKYLGRETVAVAVGRIIGYRRESGVRAGALRG